MDARSGQRLRRSTCPSRGDIAARMAVDAPHHQSAPNGANCVMDVLCSRRHPELVCDR